MGREVHSLHFVHLVRELQAAEPPAHNCSSLLTAVTPANDGAFVAAFLGTDRGADASA